MYQTSLVSLLCSSISGDDVLDSLYGTVGAPEADSVG